VINAWAAAATNNLIDAILDGGQVSSQTDIVVANAVYFKGTWHVPFDKEFTKDSRFHRLDGSSFDAPFMRSWARHYVACHDGFKVLRLRYKEGRGRLSPPSPFSMCVFLPDARDGLAGLVDTIASSGNNFIREHLPTSLVAVGKLRLPRFKLTFSGNMSDVLRRLGLQVAFDEKEADLRGMVEDDGSAGRPLALESVFHKAVIEVNEEGTEAAAVTAKMMCGCSAPKQPRPVPVDFVADHPFLFFVIEEKTGAIVFAGTVLEPSPSMPGEKPLRRAGREHRDVNVGPVQCRITSENANRSLLSSLRHCLRCLFG
jgi:serpin B